MGKRVIRFRTVTYTSPKTGNPISVTVRAQDYQAAKEEIRRTGRLSNVQDSYVMKAGKKGSDTHRRVHGIKKTGGASAMGDGAGSVKQKYAATERVDRFVEAATNRRQMLRQAVLGGYRIAGSARQTVSGG